MKRYIKITLTKINIAFNENKFGFILEILSYFFIFSIFLTVLLFSNMDFFHYIPIALSILLSVSTLLLILNKGKIYLNYYVFALLLFVIYAAIISFVNYSISNLSSLGSIVNAYLLCLVLIQFMFNTERLHIIFFLLFASLILFLIIFFFVYLDNILKLDFSRFGGKFNNENTIGTYFSIGIILSFYYIVTKKRYRAFFIVCVVLFFIFTIMTGSRAAILVSIVSIFLGLYFIFPLRKKYLYPLSIIALAILFYILLSLPIFENYKNRFVQLIGLLSQSDGGASANTRLAMIKDGFAIWLKNILFGSGAYSFSSFAHYGTYSHAAITELLVNFGLIGTALFYIPPLFTIISKQKNKYFIFRFIFIFANFIFASFFLIMYYSKIFLIVISLIVSSDFLENKYNQNYVTISFKKIKPFIIISKVKSLNKINKNTVFIEKYNI